MSIKRIYAKITCIGDRSESDITIYTILENGFICRSGASWTDIGVRKLSRCSEYITLGGIDNSKRIDVEKDEIMNAISAISEASNPNGGKSKLEAIGLRHSVDFNGFKVRWLNQARFCAVCLRSNGVTKMLTDERLREHSSAKYHPIDTFGGYKRDDTREQMWVRNDVNFADNDDLITLDSESKILPFVFSICEICNPRTSSFKGNSYRRLKRRADGSPMKCNPNVDKFEQLYQELSKCWPSFKTFSNPAKFRMERSLRKWAKRNPSRISTESARNFFKMTLGISDLESFIRKSS